MRVKTRYKGFEIEGDVCVDYMGDPSVPRGTKKVYTVTDPEAMLTDEVEELDCLLEISPLWLVGEDVVEYLDDKTRNEIEDRLIEEFITA